MRFDIPFLHAALRLSQETTAAWLLKTTDILEAARLGLFGPAHTFGLNLLCQHNHVAVKSGSGLQAIQFALTGQWDALLSYCADDVRILCDLYRRRLLNNPRFHRVIDLRAIAHASTYEQDREQDRKQDRKQDDKPRATQEQQTQTEPCAELLELRQRLAVYTEFCVCLDD